MSSSEDMISAKDELNDKIRKGLVNDQGPMIGSLDVTALYPSINVKLAAELTRDLVLESGIKIAGIDWRWPMIY